MFMIILNKIIDYYEEFTQHISVMYKNKVLSYIEITFSYSDAEYGLLSHTELDALLAHQLSSRYTKIGLRTKIETMLCFKLKI